MSAFDHLLGQAFDRLLDVTSAPTLSKGPVTVPCVCTPIARSKELRDAGFWPTFHAVAEIRRTDFCALAVVDRSIVLYQSADGKTRLSLKVIAIEDDGADPCVKLTLKEEGADPAPRQ